MMNYDIINILLVQNYKIQLHIIKSMAVTVNMLMSGHKLNRKFNYMYIIYIDWLFI
jgi:hypothetical protein